MNQFIRKKVNFNLCVQALGFGYKLVGELTFPLSLSLALSQLRLAG